MSGRAAALARGIWPLAGAAARPAIPLLLEALTRRDDRHEAGAALLKIDPNWRSASACETCPACVSCSPRARNASDRADTSP